MFRRVLASLMCVGGPISGCDVILPAGQHLFVWRDADGFEHQYRVTTGSEGLELTWTGAVNRREPAELVG